MFYMPMIGWISMDRPTSCLAPFGATRPCTLPAMSQELMHEILHWDAAKLATTDSIIARPEGFRSYGNKGTIGVRDI